MPKDCGLSSVDPFATMRRKGYGSVMLLSDAAVGSPQSADLNERASHFRCSLSFRHPEENFRLWVVALPCLIPQKWHFPVRHR